MCLPLNRSYLAHPQFSISIHLYLRLYYQLLIILEDLFKRNTEVFRPKESVGERSCFESGFSLPLSPLNSKEAQLHTHSENNHGKFKFWTNLESMKLCC